MSILGMAGLNMKMDAMMRFFEAAAGIDLPSIRFRRDHLLENLASRRLYRRN